MITKSSGTSSTTPQRQVLLRSPAFDSAYYLEQYASARGASLDPIDHYLRIGAFRRFNPHPLFHTSYYAQLHPESLSEDNNPLYHYLTEGAARQYAPHPLFDPVHYQRLYSPGKQTSPLEHYIQCGPGCRFSPHPLFDVDFYSESLPEALAIHHTLLGHYLQHWAAHRYSPNPLFDIDYYLHRYPEVLTSGYDPLSHYLLVGAARGYNPHPLFDGAFYLGVNSDVRQAGANPLQHYLQHGGFESRDPHPWFDSSYYLDEHPELLEKRANPLVHYIRSGALRNFSPHPLFRDDHWRRTHPGTPDASPALIQFLSELEHSGQSPLALLRLREPRPRVINAEPGVNLIGWPRLEIGVGECLREVARAFTAVTPHFGIRDVSLTDPSDPGDDSVVGKVHPGCPRSVNLFVLNADNMLPTAGQLGFEALRDRFNIAMWAWELSNFPDIWRQEMSVIDEFWAISSFNQQAVALKAEVPVLLMPQPVTLSAHDGSDRSAFGIPDHRFAFLTQFDFTGFIDRKNPYAAIAAFRRAFPSVDSATPVLVIKTNNSERYSGRMAELMESVGDDPRIIVLTGTYRRPKVISLMLACDAFISLHRAEGFGRSLAESMLMGKPVIATNYSGNTDFMHADNSCLVNYSVVPVLEGQYPHAAGQVWAEADLDHAAWYMRRLVSNRIFLNAISSAAPRVIAQDYSPKTLGLRYLNRLRLLGLMRD